MTNELPNGWRKWPDDPPRGAYAIFSGYDVCLRTNRNGNWEEIYLEPVMVKLLHDKMFPPPTPKEVQ